MECISGRIKHVMFQSDSGFIVAAFKTGENREVITGYMPQIIDSVNLKLTGTYSFNDKYNREQFDFISYEKIMPTESENIIEFLTSSFINGCGKVTAKKLVDKYKDKTIEKIKDVKNITALGISEKNAEKINLSILSYAKSADDILKLQNMNFSIEEASRIYSKYKDETIKIVETDFYALKDIINFKKLDNLYVFNHSYDTSERLYACTLDAMRYLSENEGHTHYTFSMIKECLRSLYNLYIDVEKEESFFSKMVQKGDIVIEEGSVYLIEYYDYENVVVDKMKILYNNKTKNIKDIDEKITNFQNKLDIEYDYKQKDAIKCAISKNLSIISGGPGTGKTTILNSIVKLYIEANSIGPAEVCAKIALLAPTGRASKKMSTVTGFPAYTIHRFLKWNKENDTFEFDEFNKVSHEFIVIDECSMIDLKLFSALLKALPNNVKILLVGDKNQLPPVGAGLVFTSLIESDLFNFTSLTRIYRQSDNSYIPDLAQSIKEGELTESFLEKKDDYNFLRTDSANISNVLAQVIFAARAKGITENDMQILVPVYKGINGIDAINSLVRNVFNPKNFEKKEFLYNSVIYREKDKILQLTNDNDKNIFNGDIGFINRIEEKNKKVTITLRFEDNIVTVDKTYFKNITHAYAISIHKSQGSEFEHVIMPVSKDYFRMMYNKLLYTGVSRAKKSLTLIGDASVFNQGVRNNKDNLRNSNLKTKLLGIINE